jgi:hypothetical protein
VAHHSGIDRLDSLKVLATLDRVFAHLEHVAREAPRPYHFIVLSDHGQSQGTTFLQRYGLTLGELTKQLMGDGSSNMMEFRQHDEGIGYVNVALSEVVLGGTRTARNLRRILHRRMDGTAVDIDKPHTGKPDDAEAEEKDVVVLASGNLGVISFPRWKERVSLEQLDASYPRLIPGLVEHPGIALALVHSVEHGPIVIGKTGMHFLNSDKIDGQDPLTPFGPHAARHLKREAAFPNVPDVVVISATDPSTGEVPAFEELVGNHGGLGGWQREPFLLYPADLDPGSEPIVGAGYLHTILKGWIEAAQGDGESRSRGVEESSRETSQVVTLQ